jgi:hypothetical protein
MWEDLRLRCVMIIQCYVRGWFARRRSSSLRSIRDDKDVKAQTHEITSRREEEINHKQEIERRMHPKTGQDFDILYNELEMWRLKETERIKSSNVLNEAEKHKALV